MDGEEAVKLEPIEIGYEERRGDDTSVTRNMFSDSFEPLEVSL